MCIYGHLRVSFLSNLKILCWEFLTSSYTEFVNVKELNRFRQNLQASGGRRENMTRDMIRQSPVNEYGLTDLTFRTLEIAECLNKIMKTPQTYAAPPPNVSPKPNGPVGMPMEPAHIMTASPRPASVMMKQQGQGMPQQMLVQQQQQQQPRPIFPSNVVSPPTDGLPARRIDADSEGGKPKRQRAAAAAAATAAPRGRKRKKTDAELREGAPAPGLRARHGAHVVVCAACTMPHACTLFRVTQVLLCCNVIWLAPAAELPTASSGPQFSSLPPSSLGFGDADTDLGSQMMLMGALPPMRDILTPTESLASPPVSPHSSNDGADPSVSSDCLSTDMGV